MWAYIYILSSLCSERHDVLHRLGRQPTGNWSNHNLIQRPLGSHSKTFVSAFNKSQLNIFSIHPNNLHVTGNLDLIKSVEHFLFDLIRFKPRYHRADMWRGRFSVRESSCSAQTSIKQNIAWRPDCKNILLNQTSAKLHVKKSDRSPPFSTCLKINLASCSFPQLPSRPISQGQRCWDGRGVLLSGVSALRWTRREYEAAGPGKRVAACVTAAHSQTDSFNTAAVSLV